MTKFWLITLCSFLLANCTTKEINLKYLNGYWEIDRVEKNGKLLKQYNYNEFIEYFQLTDSVGFRMKLKPSFIGKFSGNLEKNTFKIQSITNSENLKIIYTTQNLKEEFFDEITDKVLEISNANGLTYYYKKYTPIDLQ